MLNRRQFIRSTVASAAALTVAGSAATPNAVAAEPGAPPPPSRKDLLSVLDAVGKPAKTVDLPDGTTVVLLPYGGRVLGVYAPHSEQNFYWTHPALNSVDTARAFYSSKDWQNSGGDRTWLAPEVDVFLPNFPSTDKYWQPRELDPGNYEVVETPQGIRLVNRLAVTFSRSKQTVNLEIAKSVGSAPNPLRYERGMNLDGLEYAGYTQFTSLELKADAKADSGSVGLWNLVQMPHGGDLLIPTYSKTQPTICFGQIAPDDLLAGERLIRYKMRATGEHKITIRAVATAGRVGYAYQTGDHWALIIRNFFVNPSGEYVDVPWKEPDRLGYSTQACNVNSALGQFSELEYHIPAIGGKTLRTRCDDAAQVWAFRGAREMVAKAADVLLGVTL